MSKKSRFETFKRDGFMCAYCGATPPSVLLEFDHIIAVADGGTGDEGNLITACFDCNRGKAANPLSSIPKSLSERAEEIREREDQIAGYRLIVQASLDRAQRDMWTVAEEIFPGCGREGLNRAWLRSIKTFNERLPLHEVLEAAEIAYASTLSRPRTFLYFCGICWKKIKGGE